MPSSEQRLSAVDASWRTRAPEALASISEAVYFLDAEDRFSWLNPAAERLLHRPAPELLGQRLLEGFPDLVDSPLAAAYAAARATREAQHVEFFYGPLDRWFEVRAYPSPDELVVFF